jgi:CRP-like cAMP-binding protein
MTVAHVIEMELEGVPARSPADPRWETIRDFGTPVNIAAGDALPTDQGFLIETGAVALFSGIEDRPTCVGLMTAGDFPGLTRMISDRASPALRAVAVLDGTALRFSRLALRRQWETSAFFRDAVMAEACSALERARRWCACQQRHSALQRLATLLIDLNKDGSGKICVSQQTAAGILNVRRTTVTSAVTDLVDAGAISWRRGGAGVADPDILSLNACSCARRPHQRGSPAPAPKGDALVVEAFPAPATAPERRSRY